MSPADRFLTPAQARQDPAHRPWFKLVDAVEAYRRDPCERNRVAHAEAYAALLRALRDMTEALP